MDKAPPGTTIRDCPWCKGTKQRCEWVADDAFYVECDQCHACGPMVGTREAAIAEWNGRTAWEAVR